MSSSAFEGVKLRRRDLFQLPSSSQDPQVADREAQRRADPRHQSPERNALWRAGAGAGKTFNLVRRVLRMTDEFRRREKREPRLVITTFTRKATQELRERLVTAALQEAPDLLAFVTSRSQLQLSTLHGVMEQFLRRHGLPLGLDPAFRLGTAEEIEVLARQALRALMSKPEEQEAASLWLEKRGFRATLKLLRRVAQIELENPQVGPASPAQLMRLLQQSERDQLLRLRDWVEFLNRSHADWKTTADRIQSVCELWSRVHQLGDFEQMQSARGELARAMREIAASKPRNQGARKVELPDGWDLADFAALASELETTEAEIQTWDLGYRDQLHLQKLARAFQQEFFQLKRKRGWLEVEDLELLALRLAREAPEAARDFSETWDFWLIDEYQDTSPRQVRLIEALAGARPIFVVGDPQQSIYAFRGARPHVFHDREKKARQEAHEFELLDQNRRSHPELLNFINQAVAGLNQGSASGFQPMRPLEDLRSAHEVGLKTLGRAVLLRGAWEEADSVTSKSAKKKGPNAAEALELEARELARAVQHRLSDGAKPQDCAVLGRTNAELSAVARELRRLGIPHQLYTSGAFAEREEIQDLCALLIFLENPHDDANFIHLARTPWLPVAESVMAEAGRRKSSLWIELQHKSELEMWKRLQEMAMTSGWTAAFHHALGCARFWEWCRELDPTGRREANAFKFIAQLARAERQPGFLPSRFVEEVLGSDGTESENADRDAAGSVEPNRVALMTVHASKGLEFDHVFMGFLAKAGKSEKVNNEFCFHEEAQAWWAGLPDAEENLSTGVLGRHWRDVFNSWLRDENRRVLYVALTRAKASLFLSARGEWHADALIRLLGAETWLQMEEQAGPIRILDELPEVSAWRPATVTAPKVRPLWKPLESSRPTSGESAAPKVFRSISVTKLVEAFTSAPAGQASSSSDRNPIVEAAPGDRVALMTRQAGVAALGTRVHAVFEMLQRWSRANLQADSQAWREILRTEMQRWFPNDETRVLDALSWLQSQSNFPFEELLQFGEVEWGFALREGENVIEGQIDLWASRPPRAGQQRPEVWIADYKTGSLAGENKALVQLEIYACAVGASLGLDDDQEVNLVPVFLFEKKAEPIRRRLGDLRARLREQLRAQILN